MQQGTAGGMQGMRPMITPMANVTTAGAGMIPVAPTQVIMNARNSMMGPTPPTQPTTQGENAVQLDPFGAL